jgi:2-hydroxychromene-2-carboxylate isomerase
LQSGAPADIDVANPLPARALLPVSADDGAAHAIFSRIAAAAAADELTITVAIDVGCAQSYLAVKRLRELMQAWPQLRVDWLPLARSEHRSYAGPDRGSRHRAMRAEYRIQDLCRYARWRGLVGVTPESVTNPKTSELAAMAMLWVRAHAQERLVEFVHAMFVSYWDKAKDLVAQDQMDALLGELGFDAAGFAVFRSGAGAASVSAARDWLTERGLSEPFGFIALDTPFAGRAHLALIDWAFAFDK